MSKIAAKFKLGKLLILVGLMSVLVFGSCGNRHHTKMDAADIDRKLSSGVVLIKNDYYYSISFNHGDEIFFSGIDSEGDPTNLTLNPNEIVTTTSFGTGFIISDEGHIATNSHVVNPKIDEGMVRGSLMDFFRSLANEASREVNEINEKLGVLQIAMASADNYYDRMEYQQMYQELSEERDSYQDYINTVYSLGTSDVEIKLHSNIGIAYNDTYVTGPTDFYDCVSVKDDSEHDLAVIQLKGKYVPEDKHIFKIPKPLSKNRGRSAGKKDSKNNDSQLGRELFMIGYNMGPSLAITNQGIKAQITSGSITQDTDDKQILYSIATLPGSSGSPVVDAYGDLVAVNYAGVGNTQNFNYGIKAAHLKKLVDDLNISPDSDY